VIRFLKFRALAHVTEDDDLVESIFLSLLPSKTQVKKFRTKGHFGNPIVYFEATVEKKCEEHLVDLLLKLEEEDLKELERTLEMRTDDSGNVYLRFDKQYAVHSRLKLTESSDAIMMIVKFVTYPLKREKVIEEMREKIEKARFLRSGNSMQG
jgi:hypothetical protein